MVNAGGHQLEKTVSSIIWPWWSRARKIVWGKEGSRQARKVASGWAGKVVGGLVRHKR